LYLPSSSLDEVDMTWHTASGLILSLTLPGHYWITLTIHAIKLALGKGVAAPFIAARTRRVLHGLYAVWCLAPALSRNALGHDAETADQRSNRDVSLHEVQNHIRMGDFVQLAR
jgi:hypothetical protein